jgi:hypothetical protein
VLFMNAIAFLASFESLSKAGTFQIVGWPRYFRLCATVSGLNSQSFTICRCTSPIIGLAKFGSLRYLTAPPL